jgi:tight adherence protein B
MSRPLLPWERRRLRQDLPEALFLLAGGLRAGNALPPLLHEVGIALGGPLGAELVRAAQAINLGASVSQTLDDLARRTREPTLRAVGVAVGVATEVGGNLPTILERLAKTLLEEENLERMARAYTIESRLSAHVMAMIPVGVLAGAMAVNREYFAPLQVTSGGRLFMGFCFVTIAAGWWLTLRLARVR